MTTTNITPNGTVTNINGTVTGAASVHAALADASDSTYVDLGGVGTSGLLVVDLDTFSLPAGAVVLQVTNKYRASRSPVDANGVIVKRRLGLYSAGQVLTGSAVDYTNVWSADSAGAPVSTQAQIDGYQLQLDEPGSAVTRYYRASVDVLYAPIPTVSVSAPSGSVTSTLTPTASWTHTPGADAPGGQTKFQVRVFTAAQYGAGGFDPSTSASAFDSGVVASAASSAVVGPLPNLTTYRAYVRTAQTTLGVDQWSAWQYSGFSTNATTSDISTVVATPDSTNAKHGVVVTRASGTPTWTVLEVQSSYDGGATWNYVRGFTAYAIPKQAVTATASTDLINLTAHGLSAGQTVVFSGLTGGAGLVEGTTYFVIASGLTSSAFKVSTTSGGSAVNITTDMTAGSIQYALTVSLTDNEAPNGVAALYRARASYVSSGFTITGAWVQSSAATWSSASDWLKDPQTPSRSRAVTVQSIAPTTRSRPQGVFTVLGREDPVVVSDTLKLAAGTITLVTITDAAAADLEALFEGSNLLLLQTPVTDRWGSRYIAVGPLTEARGADKRSEPTRLWTFPFNEIVRPVDVGIF